MELSCGFYYKVRRMFNPEPPHIQCTRVHTPANIQLAALGPSTSARVINRQRSRSSGMR